MEFTNGDTVVVTAPTSVRVGRSAKVMETERFVDAPAGSVKYRYLLQFPDSHGKMWYFDYEVEPVKKRDGFEKGDRVQYLGYDRVYIVTNAYPWKGEMNVETIVGDSVVSYRGLLMSSFSLAPAEPKNEPCSKCGK